MQAIGYRAAPRRRTRGLRDYGRHNRQRFPARNQLFPARRYCQGSATTIGSVYATPSWQGGGSSLRKRSSSV